MPSTISAWEFAFPESTYSSEDFYREFPAVKRGNLEKTGVLKRHVASDGEFGSDLAFNAARMLMENLQLDPGSIDYLLYLSCDLDYYAPTTAGILHHRLGLKSSAGALDLVQGCSGYLYGLQIADALAQSGTHKRVLLLTVSVLTKYIHPQDKGNRFLFGDAASATLIEHTDQGGLGPFLMGNDGSGAEAIIIKNGRSRHPGVDANAPEIVDEFGNITTDNHLQMDGLAVFRFTMRTVPELVTTYLSQQRLKLDEIDLFVFHQPNHYLNELLRKKLEIPEERFVHCIENYGNTVQNSIPLALHHASTTGQLRKGMRVLLCGFGSGFSWGITMLQY
jgi:3-oxoacyl-[acyl-carrier-protein] synthase-3